MKLENSDLKSLNSEYCELEELWSRIYLRVFEDGECMLKIKSKDKDKDKDKDNDKDKNKDKEKDKDKIWAKRSSCEDQNE